MEAFTMLKFNFKKSHLNFMSEWQSALIADDDEDWLCQLAATNEAERMEAMRAIGESFEMADNLIIHMLEGNIGA
jgi:hypothetical protein